MKALVTLQKLPVVAYMPLRMVPAPPAEKVERHLVTEAMIAEVRRALNAWAYAQG